MDVRTDGAIKNSILGAWIYILLLVILSGCQATTSSRDASESIPQKHKPTIGNEPLTTAIIDSPEWQSVIEQTNAATSTTDQVNDVRHCSWARIWSQDTQPKLVLAGAAVPAPKRLRTPPPLLPVRGQPSLARESVVQFIVTPSGDVSEVQIVQTVGPKWPEGDKAIRSAIQDWRFAPSYIEGESVNVCVTTIINWNPED